MNRPRSLTLALACAACSVASAQITTSLAIEATRDFGSTWTTNLVAMPGDVVVVRVRVTLNAGTNTVLGLAGLTFQPTLTNWSTADRVLPFNVPCDFPPLCDIPPGRVLPFASSGMGSTSASGELTALLDPGNVLRFAGAHAITATTNLAWGVSCGQVPPSLAGTSFYSGTDAVVFRYAFQLDTTQPTERDLLASIPLETILQQRASWYRVPVGTSSMQAPVTADTITPTRIHVIPNPSTLAPALAFLALAPRRRRTP